MIAIEHLYDRWSSNGFEDFIVLRSEIEYVHQNPQLKQILIKELEEED